MIAKKSKNLECEAASKAFAKQRRKSFGIFLFAKLRDFLITLLLMSLLVFFIFYIVPGDPVSMIMGTEGSMEKRAALEELLGTKKPAMTRYWDSLRGLFSEETPSLSLRFQKPVKDLIAPRLGLSLELAGLSFMLCLVLAVPLAIVATRHEDSWLDRLILYCAEFFMAVPGFFMAIILILLFAFVFKNFVPGSYVPAEKSFWGHLQSLLLPAFALALPKLAQIIFFFRTALLNTKRQAFIRTAFAKGADLGRITRRHMLRNSLLPLVLSSSLVLIDMLTGSLVVEQVFVLPGVGRLLFTAIEARDLPLAQGIILSLAGLVVLVNMLADLLAAWIDPRLKLEEFSLSEVDSNA